MHLRGMLLYNRRVQDLYRNLVIVCRCVTNFIDRRAESEICVRVLSVKRFGMETEMSVRYLTDSG